MDRPVKILVVDDSVLYRKIIRDVLAGIPGVEVVGIARNGVEALEQIERLQPDLLTLDVEMPDMDGLSVLREMRRRGHSARAVMCSTLTAEGAVATVRALHQGAFDFVVKPTAGSPQENGRLLHEALRTRIEAFQQSGHAAPLKSPPRQPLPLTRGAVPTAPRLISPISPIETAQPSVPPAVVAIGISTGGPDALRRFLPELPANFPCPVLIVQHMPPFFTKSLAESLDARCALTVTEAEHQEPVQPGRIYIAPGGRQMRVGKTVGQVRIELTDDPPENNCRPAVDYLFRSVAQTYGSATLSVIMTGMGSDGTDGCRQIKRAGGRVIAQSAESCVVFGMPRLPIEERLADRIVPLDQMAGVLQSLTGQGVFA